MFFMNILLELQVKNVIILENINFNIAIKTKDSDLRRNILGMISPSRVLVSTLHVFTFPSARFSNMDSLHFYLNKQFFIRSSMTGFCLFLFLFSFL